MIAEHPAADHRGAHDTEQSGAVGREVTRGILAASGLCAVAAVGAFVSPGLAAPAFVPAAFGVAFWLRRRPAAFLACVTWLWFLTPEVRRVIDWRGGFTPSSLVMLGGAAASLAGVTVSFGRALRGPRLVVTVMFLALVTLTASFAGGVVLNGAPAAIAAFAYWFPPVLIAIYVLSIRGFDDVRGFLEAWSPVTLLVLSLYGVVQFFVLPEWDAYWMRNVKLVSIGLAEPLKVRVFGPLNAPFVYGSILAFLIILVMASRSRLRLPALGLGLAALGLSQVRAAWLGAAVGIAALMLMSRPNRRRVVIALLIPLLALGAVGGAITDTIQERYQKTTRSGLQDDSLQARINFQLQIIPSSLRNPAGAGLGSTGVASELSGNKSQSIIDFDGSVPEALYALGGLGGSILLVGLGCTVVSAVRRSRHHRSTAVTAAALLALSVQAFLGNIMVSADGIVLYLAIALLARQSVEDSPS